MPLDAAALDRLAITYVGRYATTGKRLSDYLLRKVRESGWNGDGAPPVAAIVERMIALSYIDDEAFARMKADALGRRGYGPLRVKMALRHAGVGEDDARGAHDSAEKTAFDSAVSFAKKRKFGPFSGGKAFDQAARTKAMAAMCRAGHSYEMASRVLRLDGVPEDGWDDPY